MSLFLGKVYVSKDGQGERKTVREIKSQIRYMVDVLCIQKEKKEKGKEYITIIYRREKERDLR